MAKYVDKKQLDRKFQIDMMCLRGGTIFDTQKIIDSLPTADVIERTEYEKLLKENEELKEIVQNCIDADSQSCEELAELHSKIDRAIAEIIEYRDSDANDLCEVEVGDVNDVLRILRRNIED